MQIINGKKYDSSTSEELVKTGSEQACSREDGQVRVWRSKKGTLWGCFKYWPNAYGAQHVEWFSGEDATRRYLERYAFASDVEKVFGVLEEG